ncbi:MAG: serine/threonine-protein kinase [Planctomycetota bacterium]
MSDDHTRTDSTRDERSVTQSISDESKGVGTKIGRYELVEQIGEGGMGTVWVARQTEPVKRRVALKLIKAGMDSKAVLARFEQERQTLALMEHPNIARVLDGGLTPSGQPYFVMELVNGQPLDKYCDGAKLSLPDRLQLFAPICRAVQHAHQKGIVHRDLKPTNILVTVIDGKPIPKVIDFGLAKAYGNSMSDDTMTQLGAVVGTLGYMSPEQASVSGVDIDTRADIYSLGVILYELLTGVRPIDQGRLKKAALAEMCRIIREEEPFKPSARLSSSDSLPSVAALRQTDPNRLMNALRGELDWVVMKCLEKERDRRYETATELSRDILRYLNDEPVEARPPSKSYRLKKFLQRNKGPVIAACLLLVSLLAGMAGTAWGMFEANRQAEHAIAQAEAATEARKSSERQTELAKKEKLRADTEAENALESASVTVNALMDLVRDVNVDMRNHPELLDLKKNMLENALEKLVQIVAISNDAARVSEVRMRALNTMGYLNYSIGNYDDCKKYYEDAIRVADEVKSRLGTGSAYFEVRSEVYTGLGAMAFEKFEQDSARKNFQLAFENDQAWSQAMPDDSNALMSMASNADNVADTFVLLNERNWDRAEELHAQALQIRRSITEVPERFQFQLDYDIATSEMKLGDMHFGRARSPNDTFTDEEREKELRVANERFSKALNLFEQIVKDYPEDDVNGLRSLAALHERVADTLDVDNALDHYMQSLQIREELAPRLLLDRNFQRDLAVNWGRTSILMSQRGENGKAREYMNKCLSILKETSQRLPDDTGLVIDIMVTYLQLGGISEGKEKIEVLRQGKAIGDRLVSSNQLPENHPLYVQLNEALAAAETEVEGSPDN